MSLLIGKKQSTPLLTLHVNHAILGVIFWLDAIMLPVSGSLYQFGGVVGVESTLHTHGHTLLPISEPFFLPTNQGKCTVKAGCC